MFEMHVSEVFNLPSTYHTTFLLEAAWCVCLNFILMLSMDVISSFSNTCMVPSMHVEGREGWTDIILCII